MPKFFGEMPLHEYTALLYRLSKTSMRAKKLAEKLGPVEKNGLSESYIHKMEEGERIPRLDLWIETIQVTGDLEGVKRLAEDCGFVCVRKNGSLAQVLRDLAEDLEREEKRSAGETPAPLDARTTGKPAASQYNFPGKRD